MNIIRDISRIDVRTDTAKTSVDNALESIEAAMSMLDKDHPARMQLVVSQIRVESAMFDLQLVREVFGDV